MEDKFRAVQCTVEETELRFMLSMVPLLISGRVGMTANLFMSGWCSALLSIHKKFIGLKKKKIMEGLN